MKNYKKPFAVASVLALMLSSSISLAACTPTPKPNPGPGPEPGPGPTPEVHVCEHVCPEDDCGKCLDTTCSDPVCADKCPGHTVTPPPTEHVCEHVCPEEDCGKCLDSTCEEPECEEKCPGHEPVESTWYKDWYVVDETATANTTAGDDHLATFTLKDGQTAMEPRFSFTEAYTPPADDSEEDRYFAVKYSGTATLSNILIWGTGPNDKVVPGWGVGNVAEPDWLVVSKEPGLDFSVVVIKLGNGCVAHGVDNVTELGFLVNGTSGQTFTVHAMELLSTTSHNFGTPTPIPPAPVEGELEIGEFGLKPEDVGTFTLGSDDDSVLIVSSTKSCGYTPVIAEVTNYTSDYQYLYLNFNMNADTKIGVYFGGTSVYEHVQTSKETTEISIPIPSGIPATFTLNLYFDAPDTWGTEYGATHTIDFSRISFEKTDPMVSTESNSFREPVGKDGVVYTAADKKLSYTNTNTDFYRSAEIILDNHDPEYDVLTLNVNGYVGQRIGIRLIYSITAEIEGEMQTQTGLETDLIYSGAYYSEIKTTAATELTFYLEAFGLNGITINKVQLYLDVLADAGTVGAQELVLNSIEMKKSADLEKVDTVMTANETVTITAGETPDFGAVVKTTDGADVTGEIITDYREGTTGNFTAGLPTAAGTYQVRLMYRGTLTHGYCVKTVTLTINAAA